jgi:hypothetical protein
VLDAVQRDGVGYSAAGGLVTAGGVSVGASFGGAGAGSSWPVVGVAAQFVPGAFTGALQSLRGESPPGSGVRRCGRAGN